jgi:hypothetical protein
MLTTASLEFPAPNCIILDFKRSGSARSVSMSAIGLDILNIGSSKWSQDLDANVDVVTNELAPSQFMLPAVENVRV